MTTANHRKSPRIDVRLRCWCEGENVTFYARVGNLSEGGLFLRTSTPLPVGVRTALRFEMKDGVSVRAGAQVVWARGTQGEQPPGMGLRFDVSDVGALASIARMVTGEPEQFVG